MVDCLDRRAMIIAKAPWVTIRVIDERQNAYITSLDLIITFGSKMTA
jgi:hypothetical protein